MFSNVSCRKGLTCGDLARSPPHLRFHGRALVSWASKPNIVLGHIPRECGRIEVRA